MFSQIKFSAAIECPIAKLWKIYRLNIYVDIGSRIGNHIVTRMHSSRMCTIRCSDRLLGGGVCPGVGGVYAVGGLSVQGVSARGGVCQTPIL